MKTYNQLMDEAVSPTRLAQLAAKGKGAAAAAKMKADGLTGSYQGPKEKARRLAQGQSGLNKGGPLAIRKPSSALATRPSSGIQKAADIGRAIVKAKSSAITPSKPGALATQRPNKPGDNSNKMGRVPNPYRSGPNREEPESKPQKPGKGKKKKGPGLLSKLGSGIKRGMQSSIKDGQGESSGAPIQAPKRGVYNG